MPVASERPQTGGQIANDDKPLLQDFLLQRGLSNSRAADCPICYGPIEEDTMVLIHHNRREDTGCQRAFCQDCFVGYWNQTETWNQSRPTLCPICRVPLRRLANYIFDEDTGQAHLSIERTAYAHVVSDVASACRRLGFETNDGRAGKKALQYFADDFGRLRLACWDNHTSYGNYCTAISSKTILRNINSWHLNEDDLYTLWQHCVLLGTTHWVRHTFAGSDELVDPQVVDFSQHTFFLPRPTNARIRLAINGVSDVIQYTGHEIYAAAAGAGCRFAQWPLPAWVITRIINSHWLNMYLAPQDPSYQVERAAAESVRALWVNELSQEASSNYRFWTIVELPDPKWNDPGEGIVDQVPPGSGRLHHMYWIIPWELDHDMVTKCESLARFTAEIPSLPGWKTRDDLLTNTGFDPDIDFRMRQRLATELVRSEELLATLLNGKAHWWGDGGRWYNSHQFLQGVWLFASELHPDGLPSDTAPWDQGCFSGCSDDEETDVVTVGRNREIVQVMRLLGIL